jgi:hypothetical protein
VVADRVELVLRLALEAIGAEPLLALLLAEHAQYVTHRLQPLVVEKDFYMEVRGNRDLIVFNSNYEHILGQSIRMIEKTDYQEGKKGMILKGLVIQEN